MVTHITKSTKKMMETYCVNDEKIMRRSIKFQAIVETVEITTPTKIPQKKRTRDQFELSSPEMIGVARRKIVCVISSDSSDTEEA